MHPVNITLLLPIVAKNNNFVVEENYTDFIAASYEKNLNAVRKTIHSEIL